MKLWIKLSLICSAILIAVVGACCTILVFQAQENIISLAKSAEMTKQKNIANSFSSMMSYYGEDTADDTVKTSLAKYCFSRFADEYSVLYMNDVPLVMNVNIDVKTLLPISSYEQELYLGEVNGKNIIIVGNTTGASNAEYKIYSVADITSVYEQINNMAWQFVLIGFIAVGVGTLLIIFILRLAMKPLSRLRDNVSRIAQGEYSERTDISTKDEVGDLATDFNTMAAAVERHVCDLEERAERQRLFIGGVAHEFKTPMTSMLIHSDTLLNTKITEEKRQFSAQHIHEQCAWLERLTAKLLKLITLNEDIDKKQESVSNLFEMVNANYDNLQTDCDIETLNMDSDLMCSALINLCDNAYKAGATKVNLSARGNTIIVKDNGGGIPQTEIERITEPFYMVDRSRNKKQGGSGIGLALVRAIAEAHGAKLMFESKVGVGTTVSIKFE